MANQDQIMDGDLTLANTDDLQTALDSTAKLASVNTFTTNQNTSGDFKANNVVVQNTTPTSNTHVTSELYVDTALNGKQNGLTYTTDLVLNSMVVKPGVSKENYIPAMFGELKATTLTIEDPFTGETLNVKIHLHKNKTFCRNKYNY